MQNWFSSITNYLYRPKLKKEELDRLKTIKNLRDNLVKVRLRIPSVIDAKLSSTEGFLSIPHDSYSEAQEGIFLRMMESKTDCKFDFERDWIKAISKIEQPFEDYFFILVRFEEGAKFFSHYHTTPEYVYILQGNVLDGVQGKLYYEGDIIFNEAGQIHSFEPLSDGVALAVLMKTQKEKTENNDNMN